MHIYLKMKLLIFQQFGGEFFFFTAPSGAAGTDCSFTQVGKITTAGQYQAYPLGVSTPSFSFSNDTNTGMTRPTGDTLQFVTGGSERVRIDSSGLVGIGTSSPVAPLHIQGLDQTEGTVRLSPHSNKGSENSHIHYGSTGDWYIRSASTSGKVIINDGGGNVGIGESSPESIIHIKKLHQVLLILLMVLI